MVSSFKLLRTLPHSLGIDTHGSEKNSITLLVLLNGETTTYIQTIPHTVEINNAGALG